MSIASFGCHANGLSRSRGPPVMDAERVWVIRWENPTIGSSGFGTDRFTFHEAERICNDLNRLYTVLRHYPQIAYDVADVPQIIERNQNDSSM